MNQKARAANRAGRASIETDYVPEGRRAEIELEYESACRAYLLMTGGNPDQIIRVQSKNPKIVLKMPRWRYVVDNLLDIDLRVLALTSTYKDREVIRLKAAVGVINDNIPAEQILPIVDADQAATVSATQVEETGSAAASTEPMAGEVIAETPAAVTETAGDAAIDDPELKLALAASAAETESAS